MENLRKKNLGYPMKVKIMEPRYTRMRSNIKDENKIQNNEQKMESKHI